MLYNPRWEVTPTHFMAWLETKDSEGEYNWNTAWCSCLVGEWLGEGNSNEVLRRLIASDKDTYDIIIHVARTKPWTYGAALERLRGEIK